MNKKFKPELINENDANYENKNSETKFYSVK